MSLSELSVKRPVFITCVLLSLMVLGLFSFSKLPVELFPDVTFPVVTVTTPYPGAGPEEVELLISKPLEEEIGTIAGIKTLTSYNREGVSVVVAEFTLETDVKYAEQQVRDKVSTAKRDLPEDIEEPTIRKLDPSDQPIMNLTLSADMDEAKLYDLADQVVRPRLEQVNQVGLVEVLGGRKREIQVELDRNKLRRANISVTQVATSLAASGQNIPAGSLSREDSGIDMVFRTVGEFKSVKAIEEASVSLFGNDRPTVLSNLGTVTDGLEDPDNYAFWNGRPTMVIYVYKQSGANTVTVSEDVLHRITQINEQLKEQYPNVKPQLTMVSNQARYVKLNAEDVLEAILIGIFLTVLVVYFFLGSARSTLITGVALPVSLIGAMVFIWFAGFSFNIMSLLAFSLAVGLLIDDAIVVRENIFRHMEMGKSPRKAALEGTREVTMAVIAVTCTILAVFFPIGFLNGVVGQFFKQFGLTVCFIMMVSLFDALTNAPMMSAYFGGSAHGKKWWLIRKFDDFQTWMENKYHSFLQSVLKRPYLALLATLLVVIASVIPLTQVPKTFLPTQDSGEFSVSLELKPGASLEQMRDVGRKVDEVIRKNPEVVNSVLMVGSRQGEKNKADFFVNLKPFAERSVTTSQMKERVRKQLAVFADANPKVKDVDYIGGGLRPFTLHIIGQNLKQIEGVAAEVEKRLEKHPALVDVDNSYRPGKPEFQVDVQLDKAQNLGVTSTMVGRELRAQVEGVTPTIFRENGLEYDVRVRLKKDQRDLQKEYPTILVPNMNGRLVSLASVSKPITTTGPASIDRENRGRFIEIGADLRPGGPGMGAAVSDVQKWLSPGGEIKMPPGVSYRFVGQAENFQELITSMLTAAFLGLIFIYLVLSSLYESFFLPFTIMLVIPLAACGAFFGLWVGGVSLDLYSMIGCIMLMGLATKNSIILVDYINQLIDEGKDMKEAIVEAGRIRLRPILMTSLALIAGMVPIAIGLNEVSNERRSLGFAVIGGVISSTFLTLIVIPAVFSYMEHIREWLLKYGRRLTSSPDEGTKG
jgi:HAE1 family hydrophobic/amphiphilic exporter-1